MVSEPLTTIFGWLDPVYALGLYFYYEVHYGRLREFEEMFAPVLVALSKEVEGVDESEVEDHLPEQVSPADFQDDAGTSSPFVAEKDD